MSNNLDPDKDWRFVGPDLGPNCLQRLSADDTSGQRVKRDCPIVGFKNKHAVLLDLCCLYHLNTGWG